jgi:6-pyruvoyltetrahydropterin/6-carboxytetrahydropterin synthase
VELVIEGEVDPETGFLMDYADIAKAALPYIKQLDHTHLNDISDLKFTTTEYIAHWLWNRLKSVLPTMSRISIRESELTRCDYTGD